MNWQKEIAHLLRGPARKWLGALLLLALLRGLLYAFVVPPWQHPDETTQYEQIRYIAESHKFGDVSTVDLPIRREIAASMLAHNFWPQGAPSLDSPDLAKPGVSMIGMQTFAQPKLYYVLAAAWLTPWLGASVEVQLYALRILSVLQYVLLVAASFLAVRILYPENLSLAAAAGGFLVFLPGLTDMMSAVNNDALLNSLAACFFLLMAWVFRRAASWRSALLAVVLLAAATFTKATALSLLISLPVALIAYSLSRTAPPDKKAWALVVTLVVLGVGLAGVVLNGTTRAELVQALGQYLRTDVPKSIGMIVDPERLRVYVLTINLVFYSFWAMFGWRGVPMARPWYAIPLAAMVLAALGLVIDTARYLSSHAPARTRPWRSGYLATAFVATAAAWGLAILRSQAYQGGGLYYSHGRYAFVAILPFALLLVVGLQALIPGRFRKAGLWLFLAGMVAFDAIAFWGYLVHYYYAL